MFGFRGKADARVDTPERLLVAEGVEKVVVGVFFRCLLIEGTDIFLSPGIVLRWFGVRGPRNGAFWSWLMRRSAVAVVWHCAGPGA